MDTSSSPAEHRDKRQRTTTAPSAATPDGRVGVTAPAAATASSEGEQRSAVAAAGSVTAPTTADHTDTSTRVAAGGGQQQSAGGAAVSATARATAANTETSTQAPPPSEAAAAAASPCCCTRLRDAIDHHVANNVRGDPSKTDAENERERSRYRPGRPYVECELERGEIQCWSDLKQQYDVMISHHQQGAGYHTHLSLDPVKSDNEGDFRAVVVGWLSEQCYVQIGGSRDCCVLLSRYMERVGYPLFCHLLCVDGLWYSIYGQHDDVTLDITQEAFVWLVDVLSTDDHMGTVVKLCNCRGRYLGSTLPALVFRKLWGKPSVKRTLILSNMLPGLTPAQFRALMTTSDGFHVAGDGSAGRADKTLEMECFGFPWAAVLRNPELFNILIECVSSDCLIPTHLLRLPGFHNTNNFSRFLDAMKKNTTVKGLDIIDLDPDPERRQQGTEAEARLALVFAMWKEHHTFQELTIECPVSRQQWTLLCDLISKSSQLRILSVVEPTIGSSYPNIPHGERVQRTKQLAVAIQSIPSLVRLNCFSSSKRLQPSTDAAWQCGRVCSLSYLEPNTFWTHVAPIVVLHRILPRMKTLPKVEDDKHRAKLVHRALLRAMSLTLDPTRRTSSPTQVGTETPPYDVVVELVRQNVRVIAHYSLQEKDNKDGDQKPSGKA